MQKYAVLALILLAPGLRSQTISSQIIFTEQQLVETGLNNVNNKNAFVDPTQSNYGIFGSAESSNGVNWSTVAKIQQVGIDLGKEGLDLRNKVLGEQAQQGVSNPQGCSAPSSLSPSQTNFCSAATMLESVGITVLQEQPKFRDAANESYQTMADVSAVPLSNVPTQNFSVNSNGLPVPRNMLYNQNTDAIKYFNELINSLNKTSEYKGLKYSTKDNYFYLGGKKYPTSVLQSRDAMLRAGIDKATANFAFAMLSKKSKLAQETVTALLKSKKLYDGKRWSILTNGGGGSEAATVIQENNKPVAMMNGSAAAGDRSFQGSADLSSSLASAKTMFRTVNGIPLGLSSDNIFQIVSRKYREKDQLGFFHNSSRK